MPATGLDDDLFELLFDALPLGVTVTHFPTDNPREGYLVAANPAADRVLGFPVSDFIGVVMANDGVANGFDATEVDANQERSFDVAISGVSQTFTAFEVEHGPGAGHYRSVMFPLAGRRCASVFHRADTEIVAAQALEWAMRRLEQSNADLDRYAHTVAHDLKNPLAGISGYAQILRQQRADLAEPLHKPADRIVELSHLATSMIDGLLEYSAQPPNQRAEWVELDQVREWVEGLLAEQLAAAHATIAADPLPAAYGNEAAIRQVYLNLVSNSIRYRRPDRPLHITMTARRTAADSRTDRHSLEVVDNGIGIAVEDRHRVFEWGYRSERGAQTSGTGLGLAACRAVLGSMGADIFVGEPPIGGGTNITIVIATTA